MNAPRKSLVTNRRMILKGAAALMAGGGVFGGSSQLSSANDGVMLPFENGDRPIVKYPQKRRMIGLTSRPPQLETPFAVFNESVITPNDAFFVRYHLADVPLEIDPDKFAVEIRGNVEKPAKLSLADIRKMPASTTSTPSPKAQSSRRTFGRRRSPR
jgi:sulfite dehydrogenase (cytochrome) subunit A